LIGLGHQEPAEDFLGFPLCREIKTREKRGIEKRDSKIFRRAFYWQSAAMCTRKAHQQHGARGEFFGQKSAWRARNLFLLVFVCLSHSVGLEEFYLGAFSLMKFMFIY
jgi:hypothetical protein